MSLLLVLKQPFERLPLPPPSSFLDKSALITGGNSGIGLQLAVHLARLGASRLIITGRDVSKSSSALSHIRSTATNPSTSVEFLPLDLGSFSTTIEFAEKVKPLGRLDYVFLNAGMYTPEYRVSSDGWEEHLQSNVLSTTLLALLLMPKLLAEAQDEAPHLVITTSSIHLDLHLSERTKSSQNVLSAANTREHCSQLGALTEQYSLSKLFQIYVTRELAKIVPRGADGRPRVVVNCAQPGLVHTGLSREHRWLVLALMHWLFGWTAEKGARNLVDAALRGSESMGEYISSCQISRPSKSLVLSDEGQRLQRKVWGEILEVLQEKAPGVGDWVKMHRRE